MLDLAISHKLCCLQCLYLRLCVCSMFQCLLVLVIPLSWSLSFLWCELQSYNSNINSKPPARLQAP